MSYPNRGHQHFNNKKRNRGRKNQNFNIARPYNLKARFTNFTARFQAPHHDEPEDLTDDLAPKVSAPSVAPLQVPAPSMSQPQRASFDNKLNFKFQKTKQTTPDWSKYQDNFKRISAASPDTDPEETHSTQAEEQKPQSKWDQQAKTTDVNTGFEDDVEMKEARELTTSDLTVAVTIEPFQYLASQQVKQIADDLVSQIQDAILKKNGQYVPAFHEKPVHNLGYLPLTCQSAQDLLWLHETVANMVSPVPNTKLVLKSPSTIPQCIKIGMFLPNFSGSLEQLKMLLQKQNHWYDMSSWTLINSQKQGDDPASYYLLYCVPENQSHIINNRDRRMAYALGTVFINVYSKEWNGKLQHNQKGFDFRNIAKHLLVCVVTEPFHYLTLLEVELIKLALNYRLEKTVQSETDEYMPAFRGHACHYKGGLRLWCESDRDLRWLKESVACLASPIVGTKLVVKEQSKVPERAKARIFLPRTEEDEARIFSVLKCQNQWCDMKSWALFSAKKSGHGVALVFYIPVEQIKIVRKKQCKIFYMLGQVDVKFDSCYYE